MRPPYRLLPALLLLLAAPLASCGHPAEPPAPAARASLSVAVAACMGRAGSAEVEAVPPEVREAIAGVLRERGLEPVFLPADELVSAFSSRRLDPHRLAYLAEREPDAQLLLLLDAEPRFFSQLSGRYRWSVGLHLALAARSRPEEAVTADSEAPVFLQYHHEREPEALEAAAPLLARQLGFLLDAYLGGLQEGG